MRANDVRRGRSNASSGGHTMTRALLLVAMLVGCALPAWAQSVVVESYHLDAVGSVRAVTNQSGQVVRRHDYFPFGDGSDGTTRGQDTLRYTGKERDPESGLDYFGARYYASRVGRFTTPDEPDNDFDLTAPQSLNRYAYARNNPLRYVDPDGRAIETPWDVFNVGLGVASFASNIRAGNYGSAALDAAGLVYDSVATAVPVLPGGAGSAIKATRVGSKVASVVRASDKAADVARVVDKASDIGRAGKQTKLRGLADNPSVSSADRGWINQEINQIDRGTRSRIRNPPGKDLAHERGREAAKGYDYSYTNLQDRGLHKLQHKYDNFGRANKERPR